MTVFGYKISSALRQSINPIVYYSQGRWRSILLFGQFNSDDFRMGIAPSDATDADKRTDEKGAKKHCWIARSAVAGALVASKLVQ